MLDVAKRTDLLVIDANPLKNIATRVDQQRVPEWR